ncbi:TIGR00375 family protein [Methanolobus mangrovi]|uniref:TIGR00375 family protein n=1 Tax=Methanolobus mangrovi TaxID=3072977 RepID=A0AA51UGJ8_9EURY|nr:TIGR00375 family protein [Methanolobus mangrovi]WMW21311.1 TIGR00375 family protein [Methanolobus mangrovi]
MLINADLHLHSKYSMACSNKMELPVMAEEAAKKGIDLVATGDCTHPDWLKEIKKAAVNDETVAIGKTNFIITTEVEDSSRVHHLLILPSISKAEELAERLSKYTNLKADGRPTVRLNGCEIAEIAKDIDAMIGPCHAFTPWTALYAYHDSLKSCYGDMKDYVSFLELGLSADSDYADRIEELHRLTFLSNSDAHSPWSNKLAREFNQLNVPEISFEGLRKAILREDGYGVTHNVGFYPQEGKYNESACIKCFTHYSLEECLASNWKCANCGGLVKKGVKDRVNELANFDEPKHPPHRPPYVHLMPLSEIIMTALGHASINTKGVQTAWNGLMQRYGNELNVLLNANTDEMSKMDFLDKHVVNAILAFREKKLIIHPGGGGQYGHIEIPQEIQDTIPSLQKKNQSSLFDF